LRCVYYDGFVVTQEEKLSVILLKIVWTYPTETRRDTNS
jgi:hypothetical protein